MYIYIYVFIFLFIYLYIRDFYSSVMKNTGVARFIGQNNDSVLP